MTNTNDGHIFRRFDSEMRHLHGLVLEMGELAATQLRDALATLQQRDVARARAVVENEDKLNALDVAADDEIVRIIARRQPMARDLREIIAVGKIVAELERAGDEARKIAGLTIRFYGNGEHAPADEVLQDIHALAAYVETMLTSIMRAFDDLELDDALAVLEQGMELDAQLQSTLGRLPDDASNIVPIVLGLRALERFGGHAKNIAGHIVFIKHGIDVRHEGVESILRQLAKNGESKQS
ncbi:MAG: phosphate signaling complex protein PhoU [bacterium]